MNEHGSLKHSDDSWHCLKKTSADTMKASTGTLEWYVPCFDAEMVSVRSRSDSMAKETVRGLADRREKPTAHSLVEGKEKVLARNRSRVVVEAMEYAWHSVGKSLSIDGSNLIAGTANDGDCLDNSGRRLRSVGILIRWHDGLPEGRRNTFVDVPQSPCIDERSAVPNRGH